jgi:two-component system, NarL family, sensor histidine kinase UhpB
VLFGAAYFACATMANLLALKPGPFVSFWLPSGLYVATLLLNEQRHWPLLVVAAVLANLGFDRLNGTMFPLSLLFCCGNSLEALAGAWLVRRLAGGCPTLSSVRQMVVLVVCSALVSTTLSATVGASAVFFLLGGHSFLHTWLLWWSSDVVGVLLLAPLLLTWLPRINRFSSWRLPTNVVKAVVLLMLLSFGTVVVFNHVWIHYFPLKYLLIPLVLWIAECFEVRGVTIANLLVALIASYLAIHGFHDVAVVDLSPYEQVLSLQIFLSAAIFVGLFTAALFSERRHGAESLQRSADEIHDLYNNAPCGYHSLDAEGNIVHINDTELSWLGYERDEIIGKKAFVELLAPESREVFHGSFPKLKAWGWVKDLELVMIRRDGSRLPVLINASAVRDAHGNFLMSRSTVFDITETRQVELDLRESKDRLGLALAVSRMGVWEWNIQTNTAFWSPECYDVLGLDNFDGRLESFTNALHPDDVSDFMATAIRALSEMADYAVEFRIIGSNGQVRWISNIGRACYDESGSPLRLTGTIQDISERKQAADELRRYARRLIEMEEELRKKLSAELHDEIGRDLTALGINVSIITNSLSKTALAKLDARIADSEGLIEGISRTTRNIMADLRPPVLDDYGLAAAIRWFADLFAMRSGIAIVVTADDPFPRFAAEQELALFRITQEALTNTAKHAEAQSVTIMLRSDNGMVRLVIMDDGKGCPLDSASPPKAEFGWGVTLMRERAELSGGTFRLDSSPGEGTTVSITITLEVS